MDQQIMIRPEYMLANSGSLIPGPSSYLRAFTSRQRDQGSASVVCYEGSGSALLPVLEEATSEDSTLVIVFILTV